MSKDHRFFELNTGAKIPSIGLGTWKSDPGLVGEAVVTAIKVGYRHIDCSSFYGNEKEIGFILRKLFEDGVVKREDLWITSKLGFTDRAPEDVEEVLKVTLQELQLDYVHLYLINWPEREMEELIGYKPKSFTPTGISSTWRAMEQLYDSGKARAIGVGNFSRKKLEDLLEIAHVPPAVNQVKCHPLQQQSDLRELCKSKGVHLSACSPLGSPGTRWGDLYVFKHPLLHMAAQKLSKTPAQVALRWGLHMGHSVLPKSTNVTRIKENFDVFDWSMSDDLFSTISTIQQSYNRLDTPSFFNLIVSKLPFISRINSGRVSKSWQEVIFSRQIFGLFRQTKDKISFLAVKPSLYCLRDRPLHSVQESFLIRSCCNGLICCQQRGGESYYVYNPASSRCEALPQHDLKHGTEPLVVLAYELQSLDFQLICVIPPVNDLILRFQVYTSSKKRWILCNFQVTGEDIPFMRDQGCYHRGHAYFISLVGRVFAVDVEDKTSSILPLTLGPQEVLGIYQRQLCSIELCNQSDISLSGYVIKIYFLRDPTSRFIFNVDSSNHLNTPWNYCRPLGCIGNCIVVALVGNDVVCYHTVSKKYKLLERSGKRIQATKYFICQCLDVSEIKPLQ